MIELAQKLEGMPRHSSTHAAGVIIANRPIAEVAPLALNDDSVVVQYTKEHIEEIGLLKFDFLGLRQLTVLHDSADMIKANGGPDIDFDSMRYDDPKVFDLLCEGKTPGVFQLEASGMTQFISKMQPRSLEDIIAGISLYRPGPMEQIPRYLAAAETGATYEHPLLEPILKTTRGCMVYQEQVMQISRTLAGFSMGQADNIRSAMSKKKKELLESYRQLFVHGGVDEEGVEVKGAVANGVEAQLANKIFDEMMAFAGYAFNKAHAAGYAVVAYQTAWLKCYYPVEFLAATLNSYLGQLDKAAFYVRVAHEMGIPVLPPDVNHSQVRFSTENGGIRFALAAVKNVGSTGMHQLVKEREENGPYTSFGNLITRLADKDINKKAIECLIQSSALDSFGIPRAALMQVFEGFMQQVQQSEKNRWENQISLFDLAPVEAPPPAEPDYPDVEEFPLEHLLAQEKEMLGLYISGHPLDNVAGLMEKYCTHNSQILSPQEEDNDTYLFELNDREKSLMAGIVRNRRNLLTRKKEQMCFLTMEDLLGSYEAIVFPRYYQEAQAMFQEGKPLWIGGELSVREDEEPKLIAQVILPMEKDATALPAELASYSRQGKNTNHPTPLAGLEPPPPQEQFLEFREAPSVSKTPFKLCCYLPSNSSPEERESMLALLRYFSGDMECYLCDEKGRMERLKFGVDPQYLHIFTARYGEEAFALVENN